MPVAGATVGAVAGAIIGDKLIGGPQGKIVGGVIGAVIGGVVGYEIGKSMNDDDRKVAFNRYALGLSKGQTGQTYQWANPQSGASTRYTPQEPRKIQAQSRVIRASAVQAPGKLLIIGEPYRAVKTVDVRQSPSASAKSELKLRAKDQVTVFGKLADAPWYLVGRGGVSLGYVPETALAPLQSDDTGATLITAQNGQSAMQSISPGQAESIVPVETTCRDLAIEISIHGEKKEDNRVSSCKTPEGNWVAQPNGA